MELTLTFNNVVELVGFQPTIGGNKLLEFNYKVEDKDIKDAIRHVISNNFNLDKKLPSIIEVFDTLDLYDLYYDLYQSEVVEFLKKKFIPHIITKLYDAIDDTTDYLEAFKIWLKARGWDIKSLQYLDNPKADHLVFTSSKYKLDSYIRYVPATGKIVKHTCPTKLNTQGSLQIELFFNKYKGDAEALFSAFK